MSTQQHAEVFSVDSMPRSGDPVSNRLHPIRLQVRYQGKDMELGIKHHLRYCMLSFSNPAAHHFPRGKVDFSHREAHCDYAMESK